ncbi:related to 15-hydroxyprostaglandin dehydrogenase [Ramularia collo-cygni]|uniref:Related to 15-hydroxyprostaglandin dehydrogenase n=1 Tax=Ramularia collo-cygni TaxID=112498 RepID=A0A2D3UQF2_9PEZI|nr:related to 15-hydroxyprostaglandin dehydrogenase [Ramularia collo-cygni]CZT15435.1 related to 15-hydroxyprostaglandin dehydrogenase [Ramularia collo-cygni]
MALSLQGKAALITGGGSGICLELTRKLLAAGCSVIIADLALRPEAEEVVNHSPEPRAVFIKTDVADWNQLQAAFDKCLEEFGRLDIVVPGAGVFEPSWSSFWELNQGEDTNASSSYKTFDININHPIRATQLAIDYFMRQGLGHGSVCMIASIAAQLTLLPVPLYCASKHAIAGFCRSLAMLEPAKNIRVSAVAPGIVKTPLWPDERLEWVDDKEDAWVTTAQVADVMIDLITNPEHVGGTVLEVGVERTRAVQTLNDPGPQGAGFTLAKLAQGFNDVFPALERNFGK